MEHTTHTWSVYIDGASRNNPGKAGAGVFITKDGETVCAEGFYLGTKTNNQAEYIALLIALYFIHTYARSSDTIRIASDSELLVKQMRGIYRVKHEGLMSLFACAQQLIRKYPIELIHVLRSDNKKADLLANKGIDSKHKLPDGFITLMHQYGITLE